MSSLNALDLHVAPGATAAEERFVSLSRAILEDLFGAPAQRNFAVRLWNGETDVPASRAEPPFTLVLHDPGSLRRMLLPPSELSMVEAYLHGDIDVEGDLESASTIADAVAERLRSVGSLARLTRRLLALPAGGSGAVVDARRGRALARGLRHSKQRDADANRFHYDTGNDFYALWLDRRMVYSCAYFAPGVRDLDAAQTAKLDHICRKLRLSPGERLLDIGCGWGALVMYAAQHYGVHAHGVTLAPQQAALAQERIGAAGLQERCRVDVLDYRDLPKDALYDKVSSVGMAEHVGRSQIATYFDAAYRLTKEGGIFLNHCIVENGQSPPATFLKRPLRWTADRLWRRSEFIDRYVFPDFNLLPLGELITAGERAGFDARDIENLRDHYAMTCRHWVRRLESRHAEAAALIGESGYRVWRLYMAAGAHEHASGSNGIVQVVFAKPQRDGRTGLPMTRDDLYAPRG